MEKREADESAITRSCFRSGLLGQVNEEQCVCSTALCVLERLSLSLNRLTARWIGYVANI
eukprot:scaffold12566_cov162-Skeletonema_menzelii.AAC.2